MKRWAWVAAAGILTTGCTERDAEAPALRSEARDSAGITIVENARPPADSRMAWTVAEAPSTSIGTLEGDEAYQLFRVSEAIRLDDGRIVIANQGSSELRVFDPDGTYLDSWGGQGEGPGEFTNLRVVRRWPGDSIMTFDQAQRRISIFDAGGAHGRTFMLSQTEGYGSPRFIDLLADGTILGMSSSISGGGMSTGLDRNDQAYSVSSPDGTVLAWLGDHPGNEIYFMISEASVSIWTHPFGRQSMAAVWGDQVVISATDSYEIRVYGPDGVLARVVRREHASRPPTRADLDAYFQVRFADRPPEEQAAQLEAVKAIPVLPSFPAFASVLVDPSGYLWVKDFQLPGDTRNVWTVFDPEGRVQGLVETPTALDVLEIGDDYILGSTTDEFDVEYVQLWSLTR